MNLSAERPSYVPVLLPRDRDAFAATGGWQAAMVAATYAVNPRTRPLCALARERAATLLVDPKTAAYQFEGYMSMEDARAVPYSPGTGTLGALWEPRDFSTAAARRALADSVFELQRQLQADVYLAPYFLVPHARHPWLAINVDTAREAVAAGADRPVGVVVCVEIDGLVQAGAEAVASAWSGIDPALYVVMVVDHDEVQATPREMAAVRDLLLALGRDGTPVLPAFCGRFGLAASVLGTAGYAGGVLELESLPRRYFREGLVNLHSNNYYLPGAMVQLPPRTAAAVVAARPEALGDDPADTRPASLVLRARVRRALEAKRRELESIAAADDPAGELIARLDRALEICEGARAELAGGLEELAPGAFHYLEVVREVAGGPPATIPGSAGL